MQVTIESKWVKDEEVVEVLNIIETVGRDEIVWYKCSKNKKHVIMYDDFLEQYKPYEPVYEYQYAYINRDNNIVTSFAFYKDDAEFLEVDNNTILFQRLDFTKRKRVCKLV